MRRFLTPFGLSGGTEVGGSFLRSGIAVVFLVLMLIAIDLVLYVLGTRTKLTVDSGVWGTYAAWASAILPTFGLVATVSMWLVGQRERDRRDSLDRATLIRLEKQQGAVAALFNGSDWPAVVVAVVPHEADFQGLICLPKGPRLLFGVETREVRIRVRSFEYALNDRGDLRAMN